MTEILNFDFTFAKVLHEKFKHILYKDDTHEYFNTELNRKLISVTTCLKKFKQPFDKEYWLKVKANQRGINTEELEKEWEQAKKDGLSKGTRYHNYIEKRLQREIFSISIDEAELYLKENNDIPIHLEFIVGNDVIGGRFDNLSLRGDSLVIKDYKTNNKFEKESKYHLINGLEHLPATEYYEYALQLSLYQIILDVPVDKREIIWFNSGTYQIIDIPYLEEEAKYIINYIRENQ